MNDHPYLITWGGLAVSFTLSQINEVLSAISFLVVIGYTLTRWYYLWRDKGK